MSKHPKIKLHGRIILDGQIKALTGIRIGGSAGALAIGGVDLPVIRNPIDQLPYVPGSSLKGKMRSLWEKTTGVYQNFPVNRTKGKEVRIHNCDKGDDYNSCPVCQIYGATGDSNVAYPTRIIVRDSPLDPASMEGAHTDLPYSEVKWEATIDRITSAATPRQSERVPAGAIFEKMQIVFSIFHADDHRRFLDVLAALQLVEDDYLGGHGSRGSGRVAFQKLKLICKSAADYAGEPTYKTECQTLQELSGNADLLAELQKAIPTNGGD